MIFNFGLYYDYYSGFIFMIYILCCTFIDQRFDLRFLSSCIYSIFYIFDLGCLFTYSSSYILGSSYSLVLYFGYFG